MRSLALFALVACQHHTTTPFPPGLEPLEPDPVPEQQPPYTETIATQSAQPDYIHVYGRGYVLAPPAIVWHAAMQPTSIEAVCSTNAQAATAVVDPAYELVLLVHYTVTNVVTVEWDDQWRFGTVEGTPGAPTLAMIRHQKIAGSSYITRSEGTIEITATPDPAATEVAFVERLDAVGGTAGDVTKNMTHDFAAIAASAHGNPIPPCP
jgi:hypothetical protein